MTRIFTDEQFEGYEFKCDTTDANVGFKHVCRVFDKDENEVEGAKSVVNWGNRTWESYTYQTVFEGAKSNLRAILDGVVREEYDIDFLMKLCENDIITDFGEMENGELVLMFDSWRQVEGEKEYDKELEDWKQISVSPYAKLRDLAKRGLLKPSANKVINDLEFVFTDEYCKCDRCGRIFNTSWGELTLVEELYEMLCDDCCNDLEVVESLVESAKDDFGKALKPTVDEDKLEELGYVKLNEDSYSLYQDNYFYDNIDVDFAKQLCKEYNGFAKLDCIGQFDTSFDLWISKDKYAQAKASLINGYIQ